MVCHPGITEVAKSKDTIVCTESTRGVAKPAKLKKPLQNVASLLLVQTIQNSKDCIFSFGKGILLDRESLQNQEAILSTKILRDTER